MWQRIRHHAGDRGGLELFYPVMALAAFILIGLVVDGGGALNASSHADYVAQEAARAGAQQVDPAQAITGEAIVVDPDAAAGAAQAFLDAEGLTGTVNVSGDGKTLSVQVQGTYDTNFASLLGYTQLNVTGEGSATLLHQPGG
ncbi:pilus assembly protein TadG-related protein [Streptomyces sp. NBC_01381]|uniref:TadE/TadG family type IV pilus assembly protein n=1 Tax=Streptomyces sp. NBC_01381 TaxID=2903845 RepID=UPI00225B7217|nr:pilus assembly protein TadG-related protein [Streptomyces sp. NBC_01381]MCX4673641.1 pilus assembly protein TadG-related protein [Streptomyces sp. NBC_01381]